MIAILSSSALGIFIVHLRVPFQLALAPFFLLGTYLASGRPQGLWLLAFVLVHIGLYGGATVYNSYYDRDEGPIGMLKHPPLVTRGMWTWSVVLQVASVAALFALSPPAGLVGLAMLLLSVAYSHPSMRFKGRMFPGLLLVGVGQGALAVLLGYFSVEAGWPALRVWSVAVAASLLVVGLYPLTQIYQIEEDGARGDMTMSVRFGWRKTMIFSTVTGSAGVLTLFLALSDELPSFWPLAVAVASALLAAYVTLWWRRFEVQDAETNHDWAMRLSLGVAAPVAIVLAYQLVQRLG